MGGSKQPFEIVVGTITGGSGIVVRYVISGVMKGRDKTGIHPNGVAAQGTNIIQPLDNSLKITDSIGIGILKRLRVNLVKNSIIQPVTHMIHPLF